MIIIGTGAGGGTLAQRLAPSGKRVLLLERGGYLPREQENWDSKEVFGKERYATCDEWVDKNGERFRPHAHYYVGGNTKFYGAILFRLRERDFGEVRHYGGVSPAWPIDYSELSLTTPRPSGSTSSTARPAKTPPSRALGPVPVPGRVARAAHPAAPRRPRQDGHNPFHLPVGVDMNEADPEAGRCVRCDRFDGFPCATDGKATPTCSA